MNTCGYCGTNLGEGSGVAFCGFCKMDVEPMKDGERAPQFEKPPELLFDIYKMSTPEIMQLHTYTLTESLKFLRDESRETYHNLTVMRNAYNQITEIQNDRPLTPEEIEKLKEIKKLGVKAGDLYEKTKRNVFRVENVLRQRIGYIPPRITQQALEKDHNLSLNPDNEKPMIIQKPKKEQQRGKELSR